MCFTGSCVLRFLPLVLFRYLPSYLPALTPHSGFWEQEVTILGKQLSLPSIGLWPPPILLQPQFRSEREEAMTALAAACWEGKSMLVPIGERGTLTKWDPGTCSVVCSPMSLRMAWGPPLGPFRTQVASFKRLYIQETIYSLCDS